MNSYNSQNTSSGFFLFNEKSNVWIKIYKWTAIVLFFFMVTLGFVGGFGDANYRAFDRFFDLGLGGDDDGFLDFFMWVFLFSVGGFVQLTLNMLIIQLLNNVQVLRQKAEQQPVYSDSYSAPVAEPAYAAPVYAAPAEPAAPVYTAPAAPVYTAPAAPAPVKPAFTVPAVVTTETLLKAKEQLSNGEITQEEFDLLKNRFLAR